MTLTCRVLLFDDCEVNLPFWEGIWTFHCSLELAPFVFRSKKPATGKSNGVIWQFSGSYMVISDSVWQKCDVIFFQISRKTGCLWKSHQKFSSIFACWSKPKFCLNFAFLNLLNFWACFFVLLFAVFCDCSWHNKTSFGRFWRAFTLSFQVVSSVGVCRSNKIPKHPKIIFYMRSIYLSISFCTGFIPGKSPNLVANPLTVTVFLSQWNISTRHVVGKELVSGLERGWLKHWCSWISLVLLFPKNPRFVMQLSNFPSQKF